MRSKTKGITALVVGCGVGVAGLTWLAIPASAGEAPELPQISAEELVQSMLSTKTPALDGTVSLTNNLDLPITMLPNGTNLNVDSAHVYTDGNGNSKLSLHQGNADTTFVRNGNTVWLYQSKDNTAVKLTVPGDAAQPDELLGAGTTDPATLATELVDGLRDDSTISVEGTARVADRPAYELVLTPKPSERTTLREIRIAIDAEKRVPLRLAVMSNGTSDPALEIAFSDIEFAPQAASEFQFTPPANANVVERQAPEHGPGLPGGDVAGAVGDGWDTVITGKVSDAVKKVPQGWQGRFGGPHGSGLTGTRQDFTGALQEVAKPVSGPFGTGYLISTKVVTALITDDGRFAAGAVPEQVLFEALGTK